MSVPSDQVRPGGGAAPSDAALADAVRAGDRQAFGELWSRHAAAGRRAAGALTKAFDPDDVVAEAYERILNTLLRGGGPRGPFRPYLFVTIRSVAIAWAKKRREATTLEDADDVADPRATDASVLAAVDASLTVRAFRTLPKRWQEVLWFTEVDGLATSDVASRLGMTPSGVGMLALRAREGLRQAWIQAHIDSAHAGSEHRWALEHVGQHARGKLRARARQRFDTHLSQCVACTVIAADAIDTSNRFTTLLVPLAVGITGTAGLGVFLRTDAAANSTSPRAQARARRARPTRKRLLFISGAAALAALLAGTATAVTTHHAATTSITDRPTPAGTPAPDTATPRPQHTSPTDPTAPPSPTRTEAAQEPRSAPSRSTPQEPRADTPSLPAAIPEAEPVIQPKITGIDTAEGVLLPVVSGTARPGATVLLRFASGTATATATADSAGRWTSPALPVPAGQHTVTVIADGLEDASEPFTVNTPTVFVSMRGEQATVRLHGRANTTYALKLDEAAASEVRTDGSGEGSTTIALAKGAQRVSAHAVLGERVGPTVRLPVQPD